MKPRSCGNCRFFTKLRRYSLCEVFDARTGADSAYARRCGSYQPVKFVRKKETPQDE